MHVPFLNISLSPNQKNAWVAGGVVTGGTLMAIAVWWAVWRRKIDTRIINYKTSAQITNRLVQEWWAHYDVEQNGNLNVGEFRALICALFRSVSNDTGLMYAYVSTMLPSHATDRHKDAALALMKSLLHKINSESQQMCEELMDRLASIDEYHNMSKERRLNKNEFLALFSMWFEAQLAVHFRDKTRFL